MATISAEVKYSLDVYKALGNTRYTRILEY